MEYENILSNWKNIRKFEDEYVNFVNTINIFLKFLYYTDKRLSDFEKYDGFINFIKYYYIKDNIIYMFLYTGLINILLKCDLNIKNNYKNNNIYNIEEIKYLIIDNENHLLKIINDLNIFTIKTKIYLTILNILKKMKIKIKKAKLKTWLFVLDICFKVLNIISNFLCKLFKFLHYFTYSCTSSFV